MAEDYTVQQGDCISSIAYDRGFFWQTIWNNGANASLKSERKDPNVLKEGDMVHIPDLTIRQEPCATEKRWTFQLKGVPSSLKIKLLKPPKPPPASASSPAPPSDDLTVSGEDPNPPAAAPGQPWANTDYLLVVDGKPFQGKTDGEGVVKITIPPNAQSGRLTMAPNTLDEASFDLTLGALAPCDSISGVKQRLYNLGYDCGDVDDTSSDAFATALAAFQQDSGLKATGDLDDDTKNKLKQIHGS